VIEKKKKQQTNTQPINPSNNLVTGFGHGTVGSEGAIVHKKSVARVSCFTWTGGTGECWICEKQTK
jgi:hypothetical protein